MLQLLFFTFIISAIIGSFIGMLSYRLPIMLESQWNESAELPSTPFNLFFPASHCTHCKESIRWFYNIPLLGYFFAARQCQFCQHPISSRYFWIELCTILVAMSTLWILASPASIQPVFNIEVFDLVAWLMVFVMLGTVITLSVIDIEHGILPDILTYSLLWLGLIFSSLGLGVDLPDAVWGACAGYFLLWSIYWVIKLIRGIDGMGYGDFKYLAGIGAWVGWYALPTVILLASVSAIVFIVARRFVAKIEFNQPLQFGPFLSISFYFYWLWGTAIDKAMMRFAIDFQLLSL